MNVLVTGATGAVGPRVVQELYSAGHCIRTLSLDPPQSKLLPDGVEVRIGDITEPSTVESAIQGIDIVIHMAALLHVANPSSALCEKYQWINVYGTANLVEAAIKYDAKRVVFFSTIAVYGCTHGEVLTEKAIPQPETFYAQTKLTAERIVLDAKCLNGQPIGTVLRLGAVYGAHIKGNYWQLLQSLARGRFFPVGSGTNRRTLVYDKDVARATVLAMQHPVAAGKIYNVTDGALHSLTEIIKTICWALGRTPPCIALPVGPMRLIAGILEDSAKFLGHQSPFTRATIDKFIEDVAVDGSLIQRELGFSPQYDLRTGWQETIQEMKKFGRL